MQVVCALSLLANVIMFMQVRSGTWNSVCGWSCYVHCQSVSRGWNEARPCEDITEMVIGMSMCAVCEKATTAPDDDDGGGIAEVQHMRSEVGKPSNTHTTAAASTQYIPNQRRADTGHQPTTTTVGREITIDVVSSQSQARCSIDGVVVRRTDCAGLPWTLHHSNSSIQTYIH